MCYEFCALQPRNYTLGKNISTLEPYRPHSKALYRGFPTKFTADAINSIKRSAPQICKKSLHLKGALDRVLSLVQLITLLSYTSQISLKYGVEPCSFSRVFRRGSKLTQYITTLLRVTSWRNNFTVSHTHTGYELTQGHCRRHTPSGYEPMHYPLTLLDCHTHGLRADSVRLLYATPHQVTSWRRDCYMPHSQSYQQIRPYY